MVECNDKRCPIHGTISVRGNVFEGRVVSVKAQKTVGVERILTRYVPKYERYKKVKSKLFAHLPECMSVSEGDIVKIGETRKLSKTKSFVVLEVKK
jgi:small subunit ribosomal protein S17